MRRALLLTALCGAFATAASANAATTVVYPTGQYPADVQNVQAAVDQGGTVLLKATNPARVATSFNFGPPVRGRGFVDIERNTELVGERTSSAATTIQGGWGPVSGFGSNTVTVRDIDIRSPLDGAILFLSPRSSSTQIKSNLALHHR